MKEVLGEVIAIRGEEGNSNDDRELISVDAFFFKSHYIEMSYTRL